MCGCVLIVCVDCVWCDGDGGHSLLVRAGCEFVVVPPAHFELFLNTISQLTGLSVCNGHVSQSLTWRTFFCSMVSTFALNILLSGTNPGGVWGSLSQPGLVSFGTFTGISYSGPPGMVLLRVLGVGELCRAWRLAGDAVVCCFALG